MKCAAVHKSWNRVFEHSIPQKIINKLWDEYDFKLDYSSLLEDLTENLVNYKK
jgi:hypothetical protein